MTKGSGDSAMKLSPAVMFDATPEAAGRTSRGRLEQITDVTEAVERKARSAFGKDAVGPHKHAGRACQSRGGRCGPCVGRSGHDSSAHAGREGIGS